MREAPKTATELRKHLCQSFEDLTSGDINIKVPCEMSNMAGKIVSTAKMQLEYAKLRKEKPVIPFLK